MVAFVSFVNFVRVAGGGPPSLTSAGVSWVSGRDNRGDLQAARQPLDRSAQIQARRKDRERQLGSALSPPLRRRTDAAVVRGTHLPSGRQGRSPGGRFAPTPPKRSHMPGARRRFAPPVIPLELISAWAPHVPRIRICLRYAPANDPSLTLGDRGVGNRTKRPYGL